MTTATVTRNGPGFERPGSVAVAVYIWRVVSCNA